MTDRLHWISAFTGGCVVHNVAVVHDVAVKTSKQGRAHGACLPHEAFDLVCLTFGMAATL